MHWMVWVYLHRINFCPALLWEDTGSAPATFGRYVHGCSEPCHSFHCTAISWRQWLGCLMGACPEGGLCCHCSCALQQGHWNGVWGLSRPWAGERIGRGEFSVQSCLWQREEGCSLATHTGLTCACLPASPGLLPPLFTSLAPLGEKGGCS